MTSAEEVFRGLALQGRIPVPRLQRRPAPVLVSPVEDEAMISDFSNSSGFVVPGPAGTQVTKSATFSLATAVRLFEVLAGFKTGMGAIVKVVDVLIDGSSMGFGSEPTSASDVAIGAFENLAQRQATTLSAGSHTMAVVYENADRDNLDQTVLAGEALARLITAAGVSSSLA